MRSYKPLIFYISAVLFLSLAYFASPISRETVWQLFPAFETMAHANPLFTALMFLVTSTLLAFLAFPSMPMICMAAGFYMGEFEGGATVLLGSALGGLSAFLFYRKHIQRPTALPGDIGSPGDPISPGSAVDSRVGACPCRRTGFHPGSSPGQAFAGTCASAPINQRS